METAKVRVYDENENMTPEGEAVFRSLVHLFSEFLKNNPQLKLRDALTLGHSAIQITVSGEIVKAMMDKISVAKEAPTDMGEKCPM